MSLASGRTFFAAVLALSAGMVCGVLWGSSMSAISPPKPTTTMPPVAAPPQQQQLKPLPSNAGDPLCNALTPRIDPELLGSALLLPPAKKNDGGEEEACTRRVWYPMGYAGLGHRLCNWMASLAVGLAWGVPPAIASGDCDRCGPHGCYAGAEDALGIARALPRHDAAALPHEKVVGWPHGVGIGAVAAAAAAKTKKCGVVLQLDQDMWLRDLTLARWGLAAQLLRRTAEAAAVAANGSGGGGSSSRPLRRLAYAADEVAVAVHVRYGNGADRHKGTGEDWLRSVLTGVGEAVQALPWRPPQGSVRLTLHVFTGSSVWAWLRQQLSGFDSVVVHGNEVDAATTFRNLADADVLVCGHSSLCFHAALAATQMLAIVPFNQEPFPYDMCPGELMGVSPSGNLSSEQRIAVADAVGRSMLARAMHCPGRPLDV